MNQTDIYQFIKAEESRFETDEIQIGENWYWNFRKHVQLIFHLVNGVFYTGQNDWTRAFKQVMRPLIRLSLWTEDIEVKDVVFFIEEQTGRALSFLIKKYHDEVYVREHDLDTVFDDISESDITYGGALAQKGVEKPEVLPLQSIAFCDQTDILGGPLFFKHYFTPSKLREMSKYGWGDEKNGATISLEELCILATYEKDSAGTLNTKQNRVPGKTIEVYIGHGNLPEHYLENNNEMEYQCNQVQIVAFYIGKDQQKQGVTLYRKKEEEGNLMFHTSESVYQRALGRGDGEALLPQQIWTNWLTIHKYSLLEAASKVPLQTDDSSYSNRNKIQDMEQLEVTVLEDGKQIRRIETASPNNIGLFENSINEVYESAQLNASAFDSLMGKEESAGMTFRGQRDLIQTGRGWHDRRRGQRAKFIEKIYRAWIIPDIIKEITKGQKFLATLSSEELIWVADQMATKTVDDKIKGMVLSGKMVTKEDQDMMIQVFKKDFFKKGNKHLVEILKDEFKDIEVKIGINVAGKQKNLMALSDKVFSIIETAMANPQGFMQTMQVPALARAFENVLEYSNIPIPDFYSLIQTQPPVISPMQPKQEKMPVKT